MKQSIASPKLLLNILLLLALLLFSFIAFNVWTGHDFWLDEKGFTLAASMRSESANKFFLLITFIGSSGFLLPANILLVLTALWQLPQKRAAWRISITALSSLLFMYLFKNIFKRSRPADWLIEQASGYSFPSGHTLNSTVFFGLLFYFLMLWGVRKGYLQFFFIFFGLIVVFIGFSRVYLRVHYPSDVLGGFCLGSAWLILALQISLPAKKKP